MDSELNILSYNVCNELLYSNKFMKHCLVNDENICIQNLEKIITTEYDIIGLQEISKLNYDNFSLNFRKKMELKYNIFFSTIPSTDLLTKFKSIDRSNMCKDPNHVNSLNITINDVKGGMITFINKIYNSKLLFSGDFGDINEILIGRPYQIIKINNFIFINVHGPHGNDNLELYLDNIKSKLNIIYKIKNLIIIGDFNSNNINYLLEKIDFPLHKKIKEFNNKENTCCHYSNKNDEFIYISDHIFSNFNILEFKVIDINEFIIDNKYFISDHKPITSKIYLEYISNKDRDIDKYFLLFWTFITTNNGKINSFIDIIDIIDNLTYEDKFILFDIFKNINLSDIKILINNIYETNFWINENLADFLDSNINLLSEKSKNIILTNKGNNIISIKTVFSLLLNKKLISNKYLKYKNKYLLLKKK
jgi:hypothetical protein